MREQLADAVTNANLVTVMLVIGGSAWLKWAVSPVVVAFELGRLFERMKARGRKTPAR